MIVLSPRVRFYFLFTSILCLIFLTSFQKREDNIFNQAFKNYFLAHNTILQSHLLRLFKEVDKKDFNSDSAKAYLSVARKEYKSIEAFVIYFFPGDARKINRVIIAEMEEDDEIGAYGVPHGFQ